MDINNIRSELSNYLNQIRTYVKSAIVFILVVTEIFAGTKLFDRLKTACIFGGSFIFFTSIAILMGKAPAIRRDMGLSIHAFTEKYGYRIQNETVTTEDGYILTMHRIQCPKNESNCKEQRKRTPVLLMHGLLGSSVDYLALGPNKSLAFQLVDMGFDVWLGNSRGNLYSRDHVMLDPDLDSSFWDFSFHEVGLIDIPAMMDHIIAKTRFSKIFYIGMSQSSLAYFVMTSSKPKYNDKILLSSIIAPVTTLYNTKSPVFKLLSTFNFIIEPVLNIIGPFEVLGTNQWLSMGLRYLCTGPHLIGNWICTEIILKNSVGTSDQLDYEVLPFYLTNSPSGGSTKQFQHFTQNKIAGRLAHYDYYGKNNDYYKQDTPPIYNLSRCTAPLAVYYSRGDIFSNIERLYQELKIIPNVVLTYKVPDNKFNHLDFIFANDINPLLYNKLLEMITNKYNKRLKYYIWLLFQ